MTSPRIHRTLALALIGFLFLCLACEKSKARQDATNNGDTPLPGEPEIQPWVSEPATMGVKNFRSLYASLQSSLQISTRYGDNSANSFVSTYENFKYVLPENNTVESLVSVSNIQMAAQGCYTTIYNDFEMSDVTKRLHIPPEIAKSATLSDAQILVLVEHFSLALLGRLPTEEEKSLLLEETKAFQNITSNNPGRQARENTFFICAVIASSVEFLKQ